VAWTDTTYKLRQQFRRLTEYEKPLAEGFHGDSKYSDKLDWQAQKLRGSIIRLYPDDDAKYVDLLLKERAQEIPEEVCLRLRKAVGLS